MAAARGRAVIPGSHDPIVTLEAGAAALGPNRRAALAARSSVALLAARAAVHTLGLDPDDPTYLLTLRLAIARLRADERTAAWLRQRIMAVRRAPMRTAARAKNAANG
jgi:hypothetical protein